MKLKLTIVILCLCILGFSIAVGGCGTAASDTPADEETDAREEETSDNGSTKEEGTETTQQSTEVNGLIEISGEAVFGEVSSIDGNAIVVALLQGPDDGAENMSGKPDVIPKEGDTESMPQEVERPERPEGEDTDGTMPERPEGEVPDGMDGNNLPGSGMNLTLTGEEQTITVDENTKITVGGVEAAISDLAEGDIVTVALSGDTVVTIAKGGMGKTEGE